MIFNLEDFQKVEKLLLNGNNFNDLQKEFINLFETKTIIAGPGTGKTTALVAKITLLIQKLHETGSREGVCIITHTNVAVEEINNALTRIGINGVHHPHFIGTVHEFFNKFCLTPFLKNRLKIESLFFDTKQSSDEIFYEKFLKKKFPNWSERPIKAVAKRTYESEFYFNQVTERLDLRNSTNWDQEKFNKYKKVMLKAIIARKKEGFLQFDDTFIFSYVFLKSIKHIEILRKRFKYVFIDEFQDTHPLGTNLLDLIFNNSFNVFQKIGDPFQTIFYNQPMPIVDERNTFFLNLSNRFGNQISEPLNVIMPKANIESAPDIKSFKPVILIYSDEKKIYDSYRSLLSEFETLDEDFRNSTKKDKVLIWARHWTKILKPGKVYANVNNKRENPNTTLKNIIINFLHKLIIESGNSDTKLKLWIRSHEKISDLNVVLINIIKERDTSLHKKSLIDIINSILNEGGAPSIKLNHPIFNEIQKIICSYIVERVSITESEKNDIFTIHSVKGETLRSALVVDFEKKLLTKILLHRYGLYEAKEYIYTDHNLFYVAMSRVTHLFVFAMHVDDWNKDLQASLESTWTIKIV